MAFNSKSTTSTPKALATQVMTATANQRERLANQRDNAVSQFRATVTNLRAVNAALDEDIALADEFIAFYTQQKEQASKAKADNEAVCEHILKIIGE